MASTYLQQGFSRGRGFPELPSGLGHNLLLPPLPAPSLSSGTSHQGSPFRGPGKSLSEPSPHGRAGTRELCRREAAGGSAVWDGRR